MIKKSVFEDEIIEGMQKELFQESTIKQASSNLTKAIDYLNYTIDIFEEAGLSKQADKVINLLSKIANFAERNTDIIPFKDLEDKGVSPHEIKYLSKSDLVKLKVNKALRELGKSEEDIKKYLGPNFMTDKEIILSENSKSKEFDNSIKEELNNPSNNTLFKVNDLIDKLPITNRVASKKEKVPSNKEILKNFMENVSMFSSKDFEIDHADDNEVNDLLHQEIDVLSVSDIDNLEEPRELDYNDADVPQTEEQKEQFDADYEKFKDLKVIKDFEKQYKYDADEDLKHLGLKKEDVDFEDI